jgi:hypothetical protein
MRPVFVRILEVPLPVKPLTLAMIDAHAISGLWEAKIARMVDSRW